SEEIMRFIGILLFMGINSLPSLEDYWKAAFRSQQVADSMASKRFRYLRSHIHFNDNTKKDNDRFYKMAKWKGQVHGYGGGRDQLSEDSATVQLSLVDSTMKPIPVNNSLEDFIMYIPRAQETVSEPTLIEPSVSSMMALSVHNIVVPAPRVAVTLLIQPQNDSDGADWVLAWSSSTLNASLEYADNLMYFSNLTYYPDTGFYEAFLDSDTIGDVTGVYTVGIGSYNATIPEPQEHPCFEDPPNNTVVLSYDSGFNSSYFFSTFVSSCLFFNKELLTWSSDGCRVIGANSSVTVCACNHLTSFGSGFFIMPNTIDFSYVFANAGFTDNLTIYLVLIISLGLYFIGLIYARIMDKKDVEKVGATPLADNNPSDHYLYNIMVHTGQLPNSGTKSKVHFLLVGDWDETEVRTLNDDKRPLLTRGASDHFIMATERALFMYLQEEYRHASEGLLMQELERPVPLIEPG
ncbi:polycystin-1-like protein 2, partial [Cherax quadricarinatus]|uniref:polycystin-1-like protein 2 n=1 Tax=Cherax quadricarinatus TaxID=27406 RepID=UPI00387E741C